MSDVTIIGVGNPYRRDDGAGKAVVERLRSLVGERAGLRLLDLDGEPVRLLQAWEGADDVVIVDAVRSGAPPGTRHEAATDTLAEHPSPGVELGGGHLLGISEAVALARALDALPPRLRVIGVEGASFDHGEGLSPEVDRACSEVADELARWLGAA